MDREIACGNCRRPILDCGIEIDGRDFCSGTCAEGYRDFGEDLTDAQIEAWTIERLPELLRSRACPAGLPWTGDDPDSDHGHTDCWLMHLAANEIERLRGL